MACDRRWKFDGPNSEVSFGNRMDAKLDSIKNPVTGKPASYTRQFTGLLTDRSELMTTKAYSVNHPEMSFSHPGKYGQTFKFNYSGEGEV
jgi:hypothetical protein